MHVAAVSYELHLPLPGSLKEKRAVIKPLVDGLRRRCAVAAAEVGHHDLWQRSTIGIAAVASTEHHVLDLLDAADRFVWSHPELEVIDAERRWLDD